MSESDTVYTPDNFVQEYNALVVEYAKLEERARAAQIERIAILLESKTLNNRYDVLRNAKRNNKFSPDFCRMVEMLGHIDGKLDGNVKELQYSYNPNVT